MSAELTTTSARSAQYFLPLDLNSRSTLHCFRPELASHHSSFLVHPVQMVDWTGAFAQGEGFGNGGRDIGFGEHDGLRQAAIMGEMAGDSRREGTAGAMRGIRFQAGRLENLLFDTQPGLETEQIGGF